MRGLQSACVGPGRAQSAPSSGRLQNYILNSVIACFNSMYLFWLSLVGVKCTMSLKKLVTYLNSPKKRTKLTILSKEEAQDSEFRSFFGRIEMNLNCF